MTNLGVNLEKKGYKKGLHVIFYSHVVLFTWDPDSPKLLSKAKDDISYLSLIYPIT